ncbi:GDP-D-glucose phosphorylase 1 isoform X2 [Choristoneura fumiferana]|uniref:GDP-D-glucose phosphorylase 1 isoform X2 n=1 Tax=Choristoneura fumiferana TaxID=7141 RepID=UPI003D15D683
MLTITKPNSENAEETINIDSPNFLQLLKIRWDEVYSEPDVFRYKINNLREKIIDYKYILLLNKDRGFKRRTPEFIADIRQPFDSEKFNFSKVSPKEILFEMRKTDSNNIHTFLVNVSPISQYHTLLCPSVNLCLPQVVTEDSLKLAIEVKFLAQDRNLKLGFNSLCAFASVNHLHYHLLFDKNTWLVETAKCRHLKGRLYVCEVNPVPAFCFEVTKHTILQEARNIFKLIEYFLEKSIGHNILMVTGKPVVPGNNDCEVVRVLVTPRKSTAGVKQLTSFNVAVYELNGWFPVFNAVHNCFLSYFIGKVPVFIVLSHLTLVGPIE